jgi:hypothetical protein
MSFQKLYKCAFDHPFADQAHWRFVADSKERDDVGMPKVSPSNHFIEKGLTASQRAVQQYKWQRFLTFCTLECSPAHTRRDLTATHVPSRVPRNTSESAVVKKGCSDSSLM